MKRFFTLIAAAMTFMTSGWSQTVTDIVVNSENHTYLEAAVIEAGLNGTLSGPGPFTLFAPTDDAFNALLTDLDITVDSLLNIPILAEILTYHVVADSVVSDSLVEGGTATTVYGADVTFSLMGGPMVNNANIGPADNLADNGVVHVIDAVLLPVGCTDTTACNYDELALFDDGSCVLPGDSCDDGDDATVNDAIGEDCGCAGIPATVVDIVVGSESHNVLEAAVVTAGLVDALSAEGPFTVFAPTDAAFEALLAGLNVEDTDLLALAELTQILTYHVASGAVMSSELTDGQTVPTLNGQDLTISIMNDTVTVNGTAIVTVADVEAGNGVVHIIDGVLVPDTITGCMNADACNYSLVATEDDGSCVLPGDSCDDGDDATVNDAIGEDCGCAGIPATVVDVVVGSESHNVLEAAVVTAGLVDALSAEGPFTVFAPTDAAFGALLAALNVEDTDLLALAELTQILTYHVASGAVMSSDLTDGQTVPTLNGQDLTISIMNDTVTVNGTAIVTVADVEAGNGVVHIIDGVLVPDTITGCTNAEACNYSLVATDDDMTCEVPGDACDDGDAATENDVIGEDCACAGEVASTVTERTKEWFITPNPASDIVVLSGLTASSKVSLVDLTGRTVREFVQGASVLSVGDMPRGTYLLTVTEGRNIQTKKVVVQ